MFESCVFESVEWTSGDTLSYTLKCKLNLALDGVISDICTVGTYNLEELMVTNFESHCKR